VADLKMVIDQVDARNRVIGKIARRDVFVAQANFRVVHVFLFNAAGNILLQQIAPGLRHAYQWGSSAAGYLSAGEDEDAAAARKLREELGLTGLTLDRSIVSSMMDRGSKKFISFYTTRYDGPIVANPKDVSRLEFLSPTEIMRMQKSGARRFTETFLHLFDSLTVSGSFTGHGSP
jgi:isopentenyldiphosphate isomerase